MGVINLSLEKIGYEAINLKSARDIPLFTTVREYYKGTGAEFANFLTNNGMSYEKNFNSIHDMHEHISNSVKVLKATFESGKTDKFDFKAVSVLNSKMFDNISEDDYALLKFDISSFSTDDKDKIKNAFFGAKCKSFVYFKEADNDELRLFYNRKGITLDENNAVKIYTSKDKVSITEGYKSVKDANYISSGFILELSKKMHEFGFNDDTFAYSYNRADGLTNTMEYSVSQILQIANTPKEEKDAIEKKEAIRQEVANAKEVIEVETIEEPTNDVKEIAKAQIRQERSQKRQSLPPESMEEQILKSSTSQVRFSKDILEKDDVDLDAEISRLFDEYDNKELEKKRILLQEARQKGNYAYSDLKENIKNGVSIAEAMRYVTQTYKNEDVLNFASMLLTKDLMEIALKERKIETLNGTITAYSVENDKLVDVIAKRENTIKELQSTLTKKNNEINLVLEATEEKMNQLSLETEKKIHEIEKKYENELGELNELLDKQEAIIARLKYEKENSENSYKKILEEKSGDIKRLESEVGELKEFKYKSNSLEQQLVERDSKISKLESEVGELKSVNYENNLLKQSIAEKDSKISKLENDIDELKDFKHKCNAFEEQNKLLQDKIKELEEKLKNINNSSQNVSNTEKIGNAREEQRDEKKNETESLFNEMQELEELEKKFDSKNLIKKKGN
jgi:viral A-type inclusion protein, putative